MSADDSKPALLLYDGECPFCQSVASRWKSVAQDNVRILPAQSGAGECHGIPADKKLEAITLIEHSGVVLSGAAAVFRLLSIQGSRTGVMLWRLYRHLGWFRASAEWAYRAVARRRLSLPVLKNGK